MVMGFYENAQNFTKTKKWDFLLALNWCKMLTPIKGKYPCKVSLF